MVKLCDLDLDCVALPAPVPIWHSTVTADQWLDAAVVVRKAGGRLAALWAASATPAAAGHGQNGKASAVCAAYVTLDGLFWLELPSAPGNDRVTYPDLSGVFPAADRMQRAAADLSDVHAQGVHDQRPWLSHGAWPTDYFPLLQPREALPPVEAQPLQDYPFVRVEGDGVHEIAVGPVHAGIIEPGHFRFSVVGEKVLRLEQRLGYTHKGVEQRMTQFDPLQAYRLAGRVSGDSTVAYAWAYCMALESAAGIEVPAAARWLRALMLERERVANHLGDLGALGNDAAFAFALAQFSRLREDWLRDSLAAFGHRLMMDCVLPGGVGHDLAPEQADVMWTACARTEAEARGLLDIFESHAGLQDRLMTTGRVEPALAAHLGLIGMAGRASSQAWDMRSDQPFEPYDKLGIAMSTHHTGDVAARVMVRFDELFESLRLIQRMLRERPTGPLQTTIMLPATACRGMGWVEGWRGEVLVALELDDERHDKRIARCHLHDPSWHNWPVLQHAVMGNIVADFPLINKSFNLSYSGQDL